MKKLHIPEYISESAGQYDLLCDIIIQSPDMIFGNNNENVPKIISILCKIVNSKYSNEKLIKKLIKL